MGKTEMVRVRRHLALWVPHQTRLCPGIVLCGRIKEETEYSPLNGGMEDSQDSGVGSMGAYGTWWLLLVA